MYVDLSARASSQLAASRAGGALARFADRHPDDPAPTTVLDQAGPGHASSGPGKVRYVGACGASRAVGKADLARFRMLEALGILDGAATLLSAPRLTVSARTAAHRLQHGAAECAAAGSSHQFADLSDLFHRMLASCCPNQRMLGLLAEEITLVRALLDSDARPAPAELSQAADEHARLLELVETAPESPDIASLLRRHRQICH